jgi:hypothetical protein
VHILLKCPETSKLREHLLSRKWLTVKEEIACKKIISCTSTLEIRNIRSYLYKIRCKWENRIKEFQLECRGETQNQMSRREVDRDGIAQLKSGV